MPACVHWLDTARNIVHMVIEGEWTVDELIEASSEASELVLTAGYAAPMILEFCTPEDYIAPRTVLRLQEIAASPAAKNPQVSHIFICGANTGLICAAVGIFRRTQRMDKTEIVASFEEAQQACLRVCIPAV